jgi:hypothetical protein
VSGDSICSVENLDPFDVAAEKIWQEIKQHRRVYFPTARNFFPNTLKDFSPNSFWVIERLFQNPDERAGGLIYCPNDAQTLYGKIERELISYKLGAYLGEVVRRCHSSVHGVTNFPQKTSACYRHLKRPSKIHSFQSN